MASDSSFPANGHTVFDLDSHAGIMHVLASVRVSDVSAQAKNELRDLIFLYTNGGKDQTVRLALEQKISTYQIKPAPQKEVKVAIEQPTIGKFRVAPAFAVKTNITPIKPEPIVEKPTFTTNPVWATPAPIVSTPAPVVTPPPIQAEEPVPAKVAVPTVEAPSVPASEQQAYLDRIREIKALVNEKVGNPVNLVDINNEVGREYMGALLDAMKKINSGSSAGSAIERLETAYQAVELALKEHEGATSSRSPVTEPTPTPKAPPVASEETFNVPIVKYVEPEPVVVAPRTGAIAVESVSLTDEAPQATHDAVVHNQTSYPSATPSPIGPQANTVSVGRFPSLGEMPDRPKTLADVSTLDSLKTGITAGDPFYSKEVEDGLDQLLSEWSIFKKSGLFGTGPKGKEHPLFKKMASLQIPLLLAGRFEGATQEIKQSVTDYMNGWRYEQGLIYQQGETFEHYLRRVIRHILDLQNSRR